MSAPNPTPYERGYSFAGWQSNNPTKPLPGQQVDIELDNLGVQVNRTIGALADIRRNDGKLANKVTTWDSLDDNLRRRLATYGNDITVENYNSIPEAQTSVIPDGTGAVMVLGFADAGDGGAAVYREVDAEPAHGAWWQDAAGKYFELAEPIVSILHFGAVGDNASDNWAAIMAAIDYSIATGRPLHGAKGSFGVTKPVYLNGSAWVANGKPVAGQQPFVRGFLGDSFAYFGFRIFALPGFTGEAVLFGRNAAIVEVSRIHVDGRFIANPISLVWEGTTTGVPGTAAPSCINKFTDLLGENCIPGGVGIDLDQAADCEMANITYRGGTPAFSISMRLPGGQISARNMNATAGPFRYNCQNASFSDCVFSSGVVTTDASLGFTKFDDCQFYADFDTGYSFYSLTTAGSTGPCALHFDTCFFVGGSAHAFAFAGRYLQGAKLVNCYFNFATTTMFDTVTPGRWEAINPGAPPVFDFEHCFFGGGGSAFPLAVAGKLRVGTYNCRRPDAVVVGTRAFPNSINVGDDGVIEANKFTAASTGMYGLGQGVGIIPAAAVFGMAYNRTSQDELDIVQPGDIVRMVKNVGGVLTSQYTFHNGVNNGFYPADDNTRKLGIASNKWAEVHAGNGSIITSDARLKTPLEALSAAELAVAKRISRGIGWFKFNQAVAEKGAAARRHVGLTVQFVMNCFALEGLDAFAYGAVCYDEWDADADEGREAGDVYSLRTDEVLMLAAAGFEARLSELEGP
jgi:hypothetical protein